MRCNHEIKRRRKTTVTRNHAIDCLKGVCILLVLITHYPWSAQARLKLLFPFCIEMAVPLFMIISGYVYAKSYDRYHAVSIEDYYQTEALLGKTIRYSAPFALVFCVEWILFKITGIIDVGISATQPLFSFLSGGIGPGSYYYPIMIQFLLWFPVIMRLVKKYDFNGLVLCGVINFLYELLKQAYEMNDACYRLLIFRYTMLIAFGCYMAVGQKAIPFSCLVAGMALGMIYIVVFQYLHFTPLITVYWTGTSFFASLLILPIAYKAIPSNFQCGPLEIIGRASYDIFLVQMVYYNFAYLMYAAVSCALLRILINIVFCTISGVAFHALETPITQFVKNLALQYRLKLKAGHF